MENSEVGGRGRETGRGRIDRGPERTARSESVVRVVNDFAAVAAGEGAVGRDRHRVAEEADVPVREGRVHAARVGAAGRAGIREAAVDRLPRGHHPLGLVVDPGERVTAELEIGRRAPTAPTLIQVAALFDHHNRVARPVGHAGKLDVAHQETHARPRAGDRAGEPAFRAAVLATWVVVVHDRVVLVPHLRELDARVRRAGEALGHAVRGDGVRVCHAAGRRLTRAAVPIRRAPAAGRRGRFAGRILRYFDRVRGQVEVHAPELIVAFHLRQDHRGPTVGTPRAAGVVRVPPDHRADGVPRRAGRTE